MIQPRERKLVVSTVGHSNHTSERLLELLSKHGVTAVADVRSAPFSRFNPQFNRPVLTKVLSRAGIEYVFLGKELGARRSERECYVEGRAKYNLIAKTSLFRQGLERVVRGAESFHVALMCAEKDPLTCHRTILVCRHLRPLGVCVQHILESGSVESHEQAEQRLLNSFGESSAELFRSSSEILDRAYDLQAERIEFEEATSNEVEDAS